MTKIVIACDSFKESMTAQEACLAIERGIKTVDSSVDCLLIPMADGGEGTTEVLMQSLNAMICNVIVKNPFGKKICATYGMNKDGVAVMEVAASCGIDLIPREKRDPTQALSYGLGEMLKDALFKGAKKIIIGLGGSGTNDGGYGMLCALGAKFYDCHHCLLPIEIDSISKIHEIDLSSVYKLLGNCQLIVANDVENVFTGPTGATFVFGKQKGASGEQLQYLEESLVHFQKVIQKQYDIDLAQIKKSGSAGGLGGALYLLGAQMMSGIDLILEVTQFEKHIQNADYIMTSEGSIDSQTVHGKTISGIAKIALKYSIPVIAFGGRVTEDAQNLYDIGVTALFSITNEVKTLSKALVDGKKYLEITANNIYRLLESK